MKRMLVMFLMVSLMLTQSGGSYAVDGISLDGEHSMFDTRPDGVYGYQWYEESWAQLEKPTFTVDKKGTCTGITLFDPDRGLKLTFEFTITKDKLPKYKLAGNKFFYNYQTDWLQVETKTGGIMYSDVPFDPENGETYNIKISK